MTDHKDVQEEEPEIALSLDQVGIEGVQKRIVVQSPEGPLQFDVTLDAYINLPDSQRGVHLSRNMEVFLEAVESAEKKAASSLEEVLIDACQNLIDKHQYASQAKIVAETNYYYNEDFFDKDIFQAADVTMKITQNREGKNIREISITIPGMTVCPSAQRTFKEEEETKSLSLSPSHSQRAKLTLRTKTKGCFVRLEHLIEAAREAFSSPVVGLLKRENEHDLIKNAFERPRFIEDLERHALHNLFHILLEKDYSDDTLLSVEAESFESIHPHNIYASRTVTLGELKKEEFSEEETE